MGAPRRGMMPPPDILSDISRHDKYDQMSDVISQLSNVLGQRHRVQRADTSGVTRTEEDEDAETMTDVQSCLSYIDGLLATPEMINIPERGTNKVRNREYQLLMFSVEVSCMLHFRARRKKLRLMAEYNLRRTFLQSGKGLCNMAMTKIPSPTAKAISQRHNMTTS